MSGISQKITETDSTRLPNYQLVKAIQDIEIGKIAILQRNALYTDIFLLRLKISTKDSLISALNDKDSLSKKMAAIDSTTKKNFEVQIDLFKKSLSKKEREIKNQKIIKRIYQGLFYSSIIGAGYYLITH